MKDLQQAAKNLAEGSADNPLDTSRMFGELKQHGLYLNHIQEGIQHAVDERMKSERFKTELITNVSHDILLSTMWIYWKKKQLKMNMQRNI